MINCPFYPDCKETNEDYEGMYLHIKEKHKVASSVYYSDKYNGNGYHNIIKVSND